MELGGRHRGCNHLLSLPQDLLQLVLQDVSNKYTLRSTCKAFSTALANCCGGILLSRRGLVARGPRREVSDALAAFPNAGRIVLSFDEGRARQCHGARGVASFTNNNGAPWPRPNTDADLLAESLEALTGHGVTSLALLHLPCPVPHPSILAHQQPSLVELEISDSSYSRAVEQGAFNVIVRKQDTRASGDAMVKLALSLPQLRRVSLASAAFSAESIAALASLTKLESLSLVGTLECSGGAVQAAATYRSLLKDLFALRQLRLPMAIGSCGSAFDDDDDLDGADGGNWSDTDRENNRFRIPSSLPSATASHFSVVFAGAEAFPAACVAPAFRGKAMDLGGLRQQGRRQFSSELAAGFIFPPNLQDLTIPLCSLNRPVFEAACAAYSRGEDTDVSSRGADVSYSEHGHPSADSDRKSPSTGSSAVGSSWPALRCAVGSVTDRGTELAASGGRGGSSLRSLHIPTLAGYSHWEGSFLASAKDFEKLAGLVDLEVLHVSLELGSFQLSRDSLRACFQHLRSLRSLRELRVGEAKQPTCFSMRKRSSSEFGAGVFGGAPLPALLSNPALEQLQRQWPRLQTLQLLSETVVRSGERLVVPSGLGDVRLLPSECACCSGPHLLAAPPRSVGRWEKDFLVRDLVTAQADQ